MGKSGKLSILINGPLPPPVGGMTTYCQDYLRTSIPDDFNVIFCKAVLLKSTYAKNKLIRIFSKILNSIIITLVWLTMLIVKQPQIAHVHTSSFTGFYVKSILTAIAKMLRAKTIFHIHGAEFKHFFFNSSMFMQTCIVKLLNNNTRIIALSNRQREFYLSIGVKKDIVTVMPNSVFLPIIEGKKPSGKIICLFMSVFEKRKGIFELIEAIENNPNFTNCAEFIMAGPKTDSWDLIAKRVQQINASENFIKMPGSLTGKSKMEAYRNSDIYILQSFNEGLPIGLLEAMSYGLACITTPVGGIPDVIEHNNNGFLIEPGNANALADAIRLLADDNELRHRLGRNARKTIEQQYSWAQRETELKKLYIDIIKQS